MADNTTLQAAAYTSQGTAREKIDGERNLIYLRGAVAGPINGLVMVRKQGPNG